MRGLFDLVTSLDSPGIYLGWGSFQIQLGNLIVIILMVVLLSLIHI